MKRAETTITETSIFFYGSVLILCALHSVCSAIQFRNVRLIQNKIRITICIRRAKNALKHSLAMYELFVVGTTNLSIYEN